MKLVKWLDDHLEESVLILCLIGIATIMMVQVILRKIPFIKPLEWAEEMCRFLWVISVFLTLPFTIRKASIIRVSVVVDLLPPAARKAVKLVVDVIILVCVSLLFYHSIDVYKQVAVSVELSPAMLWPMTRIYIFMVIGFLLAVIRSVQMLVINIKNYGKKDLTTVEKTMQEAAEEANAGKRAEGGNGWQH